MSTGKTNLTSTQFAAKKLLGKAHTSNLKSDVNEIIPSNVSLPSEGIFAEAIPNSPGTDFYTLYSASVDDEATVERVYFDIVSIADTTYDANDTGGGGDEASANGPHGYYLKLPSNYESTSSNPNAGSGVFTNSKRVYDSRGGLQLVPPLISNASPNRYVMKIYKGDPTNPANEITSGDSIDWQVDYYAGTIFVQDYDSTKVPLTASAYLYVGKYLNEKISDISASAGGVITALNNQAENRITTIGSTTTELDGEANLTFDGSQLTVVGKISVGEASASGALLDITGSGDDLLVHIREAGDENAIFAITGRDFSPSIYAGKIATTLEFSSSANVSASAYYGDGSHLTGIITYSRRAVATTITASVTDRILGVSGSSAIEIRLPSAGDYSAGQYFTVKDESGAADTKNITILASGSQTIDGVGSIILDSPYSAVNIYSDGASKFFIY